MRIRQKALIVLSISLALLGGVIFWNTRSNDYITITEDTNNSCTYDANGQNTATTLAVSKEVKVRIPTAEFEQYKKDAIASGKCFY